MLSNCFFVEIVTFQVSKTPINKSLNSTQVNEIKDKIASEFNVQKSAVKINDIYGNRFYLLHRIKTSTAWKSLVEN